MNEAELHDIIPPRNVVGNQTRPLSWTGYEETVDNPLSLAYNNLRCMPRAETRCTLVCPGFFKDDATWAGAPLDHILELAQGVFVVWSTLQGPGTFASKSSAEISPAPLSIRLQSAGHLFCPHEQVHPLRRPDPTPLA